MDLQTSDKFAYLVFADGEIAYAGTDFTNADSHAQMFEGCMVMLPILKDYRRVHADGTPVHAPADRAIGRAGVPVVRAGFFTEAPVPMPVPVRPQLDDEIGNLPPDKVVQAFPVFACRTCGKPWTLSGCCPGAVGVPVTASNAPESAQNAPEVPQEPPTGPDALAGFSVGRAGRARGADDGWSADRPDVVGTRTIHTDPGHSFSAQVR